ncbi:MAG TPA: HEAT repeat domain-containing protein [Thermoanaerobaculia bacterium]|nr:HEAT repeat domain-containing protein [Thermoanaerobaculia bacterium]
MRLRTWLVSLLFTLPALAQTFTGTTVKSVDASRGLREAVTAAGTKWVAWTAPTSEVSICCSGNRGGCGNCSLEGNGMMIGDIDGVSRRTSTMLLAARIERGHIAKLRLFDANCPIAANGASITVLNNVTPEASIHYLVQATRDSDDDELLAALSLHEHPSVVPALIELARNDPSRKVRRGAIFWLGQKAGEKAAGELRRAVDNDPDDEVREHAVFAISQLPRDRAVPMLIDLVKTHKRPKVRERAIFWLAQTGDPRALELIEQILTR